MKKFITVVHYWTQAYSPHIFQRNCETHWNFFSTQTLWNKTSYSNSKHCVNRTLRCRFDTFIFHNCFLVMDHISVSNYVSGRRISSDIPLVNKYYDVVAKVHFLLKVTMFGKHMCDNRISLGFGKRILNNWNLG